MRNRLTVFDVWFRPRRSPLWLRVACKVAGQAAAWAEAAGYARRAAASGVLAALPVGVRPAADALGRRYRAVCDGELVPAGRVPAFT
jgi:hypothetical protein